MLVQCEFREADGVVQADIICELCGEVAREKASMNDVLNLVHGSKPVLCDDCESSKCTGCGLLPTPGDQAIYGAWVNGVCWSCRDKLWAKMSLEVRSLLAQAE